MRSQGPALSGDARTIALDLVHNIMENGAYANLSLDSALHNANLSSGDKNMVTAMVNGTVRMIKHLDWVLNLFLRKNIEGQNPWLRNILRIGVYQILFMDRVPDYAAVNSAVDLARKKTNRSLAGVCNGVLRNLVRGKDEISYPPAPSLSYLSVYYSQPEWLVQLWLERFGAESTEKMLSWLNQRPRLSLRVNALETNPQELSRELSRQGVTVIPGELMPEAFIIEAMDANIEQLSSYQAGQFYIQSETAMLAGAILAPQPGEKILDLCSGVGGKATHFAEMMKNQGTVKAVELYPHKLKILAGNCSRLGINIIETESMDVLSMEKNPVWQKVFLDAPCSGLGVLNRRADARWRKSPEEITKLTQLQQSLLDQAGAMTAPGGILVYSTCTVNRAENENVVESFLSRNHEFQLDPLTNLLEGLPFDQEDRDAAAQGQLTLIPGKYEGDGMFYARLRRSY